MLASLMARYSLSATTDLSINLQNAFDKTYYTRADQHGYLRRATQCECVTLKHTFW